MSNFRIFGMRDVVSVNMLPIYKYMCSLGIWIHSVFHMRLGENIMTGRGKRWLAIGLAVMVGCMIPVGTMKASESDIKFSYQQSDLTGAFGDIASSNIYIGMNGSHALTVSSSNGSYCLLQDITSVTQQDLESHSDWKEIQGGQISLEGVSDGKYIVCIREIQGEETIYAVSKSFVWDTTAPKIVDESGKEMTDGGKYPTGTKFTVTDLSPVDVYMNDDNLDGAVSVQPVDGKYTVEPKAGSSSCVVKAKDKAGNVKSLSLTIEGGSTTPEPEVPADNTITEAKTYILQEGTAYTLGSGSWKIAGDSSVYPGGITFYVPAGSYTFQKQ